MQKSLSGHATASVTLQSFEDNHIPFTVYIETRNKCTKLCIDILSCPWENDRKLRGAVSLCHTRTIDLQQIKAVSHLAGMKQNQQELTIFKLRATFGRKCHFLNNATRILRIHYELASNDSCYFECIISRMQLECSWTQ